VASKSGGANRRFLVRMYEKVGYLSGSAAVEKSPATHIEVILDKKGNTISEASISRRSHHETAGSR